MLIYSYLIVVFFVILCISLYLIGYHNGKEKGLREGRKDLADYALREKITDVR